MTGGEGLQLCDIGDVFQLKYKLSCWENWEEGGVGVVRQLEQGPKKQLLLESAAKTKVEEHDTSGRFIINICMCYQ